MFSVSTQTERERERERERASERERERGLVHEYSPHILILLYMSALFYNYMCVGGAPHSLRRHRRRHKMFWKLLMAWQGVLARMQTASVLCISSLRTHASAAMKASAARREEAQHAFESDPVRTVGRRGVRESRCNLEFVRSQKLKASVA